MSEIDLRKKLDEEMYRIMYDVITKFHGAEDYNYHRGKFDGLKWVFRYNI